MQHERGPLAGVSCSRTMSNAMRTESSRVIRSAGSDVCPVPTTGSGNQGPTYASRCTRDDRRWSMQSRAVTVMSQPVGSSMSSTATCERRR
jgi:hypothetical protein